MGGCARTRACVYACTFVFLCFSLGLTVCFAVVFYLSVYLCECAHARTHGCVRIHATRFTIKHQHTINQPRSVRFCVFVCVFVSAGSHIFHGPHSRERPKASCISLRFFLSGADSPHVLPCFLCFVFCLFFPCLFGFLCFPSCVFNMYVLFCSKEHMYDKALTAPLCFCFVYFCFVRFLL